MSIVHVAVAVIKNNRGEILIQQRAENTHQGGLWEFPGGKLEQGETVIEALGREINEELGIRVTASRPLIKITHHFGDRSVLLDVHTVLEWHGDVQAREDQPLLWCGAERLSSYTMPEPDVPIVTAINLSSSYVITPPAIDDVDAFLARFDYLLEQGEKLFLYRVKSLQAAGHDELVREMSDRCQQCNARLMVHEKNAAALHDQRSLQGMHLTEEGLARLKEKNVSDKLLSVSCHSLQSLLKAQEIGADFAMLSPVEATGSHPGVEPLGWEAFRDIVEQVNIPVYALGGMSPGKTEQAWGHGAQGVAGISDWWK